MSNRTLLLLALAAIITSILAWQIARQPGRIGDTEGGTVASGDLLLPEFADYANDIDNLKIYGAGEQLLVELQRQDDGQNNGQVNGWQVVQKNNHPADWAKVRDLLRELGQARVIAAKTARESMYPRLGVAAISDTQTGGGLLRWNQDEDNELIIGIRSDDLEGRYVRKPQQVQSYLVDKTLEVPTQPRDWLDLGILDWQSSRISTVTIRHADKDLIQLARPNTDALELQLQNLPEGRELTGQWVINGIVNALTGLRADDVRKAAKDLPETSTRLLFVSDNGINLLLSLYRRELVSASDVTDGSESGSEVSDNEATENSPTATEYEYLLRAEASLEPGHQPVAQPQQLLDQNTDGAGAANVAETVASATAQDTVSDTDEAQPADADSDADTGAAPAAEVERLNRRLRGWEFVLPEYKYNALNKRMSDLLKPVPDAIVEGDN